MFPYLQTTFLFAETYFSFRQCIDIDSLRYAIDKTFEDQIEKNIALSALIYAHSYCSSGTGHFAMFRDLKDVKSINDVFLYRDRDVWAYFEKKFLEIIEFHQYYPKRKHLSLSMDFKDLLSEKSVSKKYKLIYADPPYSFVHYSRFYHATESLVRYDYMMPEFKGRYRSDRHQSPFCQGQNVKTAFYDLIKSAAENDKILLLSYADTGMISLEDIAGLIKNNGSTFKTKQVDYDHSTMGREGHKSNQIKELLITIIPPLLN
jgi:adenine-specific DNA-methyltransferase